MRTTDSCVVTRMNANTRIATVTLACVLALAGCKPLGLAPGVYQRLDHITTQLLVVRIIGARRCNADRGRTEAEVK